VITVVRSQLIHRAYLKLLYQTKERKWQIGLLDTGRFVGRVLDLQRPMGCL
jgi:hypothetical protein